MSITKWIELGAAAPAAVATGLLVYAMYRWIRNRRIRDPRLCPGPDRRAWDWARARWWLTRRACGYDLMGLPRDAEGGCTCPECGRYVPPALPLAKIVVRWRLIPLALVLLTVAAGMWNVRWLRRGGWVRYTPSTVLIGLQRTLPWFVHEEVRWRLAQRLEQRKLWETQKGWLIGPAVAALGADRVRWNADWGREILSRIGDPAIPALEEALRSGDYQRRQVAADILRRRADTNPEYRWGWYGTPASEPYRPTDDLLRVSVEGLQHDSLTYSCLMNNADEGFKFLMNYPERIGPFVREGLGAEDRQQRWMCAALASVCRLTDLADVTGPMLVDQLRDDGIPENGKIGVYSLVRMGWPAVKHLQRVVDSPDPQQRVLAGLILLEIAATSDFTDDVERRCELLGRHPTITVLARNPVALTARNLRPDW